MSEHMMPIPSRLYNAAVGGHVCGPEDVDFGQKVIHLVKYDRAGNEVSFESQITQANKIYVIHDDFILSSNVTVPANCVLKFDGGSISGAYTITGSNTSVSVNGNYNPFSCSQAGTWSHINPTDKPYTSGNGMGIVYLKNGISLTIQLTQTNTIYVCQFDYTLAANITLPANSIFRFEGGSIDSNYTITLSAGCRVEGGKITLGESGSIIIGGDSVTIEGCEIHKDRENDGTEYSPTYQAIFANGKNYLTFKDNVISLTNIGSFTTLISCSYVDVLNNHIKNTTFNPAEDGDRTCGVELCDSCQYVRIQGNTIENTNLPISAFTNNQKVTNLQILGNTILNSMAYGICIYDAANDASRPIENVVISGNIIKNVYGGDSYGAGIYLLESTNIVVSDNYIENTAVNTTISGTLAPAGIGLNTSNHVTLSNNIIKTSKYYGIVAQGSNNLIQGNNIDDCPTSIEVRSLSYSRIENNIMNKNISVVSAITYVSIEQNTCLCIGWNYYATNGHNIHICRNIMGSAGFDGFLLYINDNTTDIVIDGNIFYGDCYSAIWGSPTNAVYTNNVFLCTPTGTNMQYNGFGSGAFIQDNYIKNIKANDLSPMNYTKSGASSDRPAHPTFGMMYKDTTLNKPIWFDGSNWVDATGATV